MASKKPKFYVVWAGHQPGIYDTWDDCQTQTKGFPGAKFKAFETRSAAEQAFASAPPTFAVGKKRKPANSNTRTLEELAAMGVDLDAVCVDAACKGNPGDLEYQGVELRSNVNLFHKGPFPEGTVNIGEFLAIVHALALLQETPQRVVYSDSRIGIGWVKQGKCNTKLTQTAENAQLFRIVARAEKWLREHQFANPVKKWNTKSWGEIPADFGRK